MPLIVCALILIAAVGAAGQGTTVRTDDPAAIAAGGAMFRERCSDCHGADAKGGRGPDLTVIWANEGSDQRVVQIIRSGVPGSIMQVSALFQSNPGVPITASYVATNAQVQPTLGRPLSGNASTVTITNIIQPQTMFERRINQLDTRLTKNVRVGHARLQGQLDVYNVLNASPILGVNARYGPA